MEKMDILQMEATVCSCEKCKAMCKRPCWPSPQEAKVLIEKGYAKRLMLDYWVRENNNIDIVCPALKGYEGRDSPFWPRGDEGCTFQDKKGLCEIHTKGLKPLEGKLATCDGSGHGKDLHFGVAELWDNAEGKAVVQLWKEKTLEEK
jgi:hypothetical protein